MKVGQFRLGMRTIKTALAVVCCLLFFHLTNRGSASIAALSAVFAMRQDLSITVEFGKSRIIGNTIGGLIALLYFLIYDQFSNSFGLELIIIPLLVIVVIVICDGIGNNSGIVGAVSSLLLIILNIPQGESFIYALERVTDTFIGTFIAVGLNWLIRPPKKEEIKEIQADLSELEKKENELIALRKQLEYYEREKKQEKKGQSGGNKNGGDND